MIDPAQSLAFSIQANPGVYALLLGSGVSRSAGIPTGWEIVNDLLGKLAASQGQSSETDLVQWYVDQYGDEPDYSKLLDGLAKTQSERQQLLRPYFEPTNEEREEGLKQPTAAHRAIAHLASQGHIKVVITTNFDRLIEKALEDVGVVPDVLSSVDHVKGAKPLMHMKCCVIKVHGDYMDTRIRNSPSELSIYPKEIDTLLDRVFDEFGLIVCGWSADWDEALRKAILRAKSRRYTTYWAARGDIGDSAQQLTKQRDAQVVSIVDADSFFAYVQQSVQSIEEFSNPHPLSIENTVASVKRYLSKPEYKIQLKDLMDSVINTTIDSLSRQDFGINSPEPNRESITQRLQMYESACSTVLPVASIAGVWTEEKDSYEWKRALERLSVAPSGNGFTIWNDMKTYPGMLLIYALGMGLVYSGRLSFLSQMFQLTLNDSRYPNGHESALTALISNSGYLSSGTIQGMENRPLARSEWMHYALRAHARYIIADDVTYTLTFDRFEMLAALAFARLQQRSFFPPGAYYYRNGQRILREIEASILQSRNDSPYVASGIIGQDADSCLTVLHYFRQFIKEAAPQLGIFFEW